MQSAGTVPPDVYTSGVSSASAQWEPGEARSAWVTARLFIESESVCIIPGRGCFGVGSAATLAPYLSCVVTDLISRRIFDFLGTPSQPAQSVQAQSMREARAQRWMQVQSSLATCRGP